MRAILFLASFFVSVQAFAYQQKLYVGDRAYNIERSAYVTVVAIQQDGRFVLRYDSGPLTGQTGGNWTRADLAVLSGCAGQVCTGYGAYNLEREAYVRVVGIQYDGRFVLYYRTGSLAGQSGHNWTRSDLALTRGCYLDLCVGERAYNVPRQAWVTVAAIQLTGHYVLRFDTGPLAGKSGKNWPRSDLAVR
ncbi:MAG TPA: hypothetical protein VFV50_04315 [Bdellovibrionales bacterium]|nr:hypothetical protein [Bdellovibrionales bacterium]